MLPEYKVAPIEDWSGVVQVSGNCPDCNISWELMVLNRSLEYYIAGRDFNFCFPCMRLEDKELLKSGRCYECEEKRNSV